LSIEAFQQFKIKLNAVYQYPEFKTYVLQGFREAGNVLCITQMLETALVSEKAFLMLHSGLMKLQDNN
jgi:hypothetical protein